MQNKNDKSAVLLKIVEELFKTDKNLFVSLLFSLSFCFLLLRYVPDLISGLLDAFFFLVFGLIAFVSCHVIIKTIINSDTFLESVKYYFHNNKAVPVKLKRKTPKLKFSLEFEIHPDKSTMLLFVVLILAMVNIYFFSSPGQEMLASLLKGYQLFS